MKILIDGTKENEIDDTQGLIFNRQNVCQEKEEYLAALKIL